MSDQPTNTTNNNDTVSMSIAFTKRTYSGKNEYVIPSELYNTVRFGRDKGSRWNGFISTPELRDEVRTSLYKDGSCYVTCAHSGSSVRLSHNKSKRSIIESLSDIDIKYSSIETETDFGDNEDYLDAYDYAMTRLGFPDQQADFFAQIVLAFLDNLSASDYIEYLVTEVLLGAIDEVREVSDSIGMDSYPDLDIFQRVYDYIEDNYNIEESIEMGA